MFDKEAFTKLKNDTAQDSEFFKQIVNGIVVHYSRELDEFVELVRTYLQMIKENTMQTYDDESLQMQIIKLPTILYFTGNGLEDIGAESDLAAYKRKDLYHRVINECSGTIPEKKAQAEMATETEGMMEAVYDRAYKKLKLKIDHAIKLLESMKKVADYRIAKINKGRGGDEQTINNFGGK